MTNRTINEPSNPALNPEDGIREINGRIDRIDDSLLRLFLQRMELTRQGAETGRRASPLFRLRTGPRFRSLPLVDRERERSVLARLVDEADALGAAGMEEYVFYFFSKVLDLARARQSELAAAPTRVRAQVERSLARPGETFPKTGSVACPGVEGSNAQAACDRLLPRGRLVFVKSFRAAFEAVGSGQCQYGVLPIENSSNGSVRAVYELLLEYRFSIVRGTQLLIRHELLAKPGTKLEDVRRIYSHQQALGQCSGFLSSLKGVELIPCGNTAVAARQVSESGDPGAAAIAAPQCARLYGLESLRGDIQDSDNNYTRFICIAREPVIYAGANRVSLILTCENTPGALNGILSRLAARGVNLTKLESCPVAGRDFEFLFFLELEASLQEPGILSMLEDLERSCPVFSLLGNYAMA